MSSLPLPPALAIADGGGARDIDTAMAVMAAAFDPAFGEAWTRAQYEGILGLPGVWFHLALDGGHGVGFALARLILDEAELLLLAVAPAARRRGAGQSLLDAVIRRAAAAGARRLHLEMRDNNPARALYAAAGFTEVGRRRDYYRGHDGRRYDAITLSRPCGMPAAFDKPAVLPDDAP